MIFPDVQRKMHVMAKVKPRSPDVPEKQLDPSSRSFGLILYV